MPLAYIHWLDRQPPLIIWGPDDPRPEVPIVIPCPPLIPTHPIVIPPGSISDGVPTHPIYIPPEVWVPVFPAPPIANVPGVPPTTDEKPPGTWGGSGTPMPTPPIANVPGAPPTTDEKPPGTWGGAGEPMPTPPIVIPPVPPPLPGQPGSEQAKVLIIYNGEAVWFTIDNSGNVKPPPSAQPKPAKKK